MVLIWYSFIPYGYDTSGLAPFTFWNVLDSLRSRGSQVLNPGDTSGLAPGSFIQSGRCSSDVVVRVSQAGNVGWLAPGGKALEVGFLIGFRELRQLRQDEASV